MILALTILFFLLSGSSEAANAAGADFGQQQMNQVHPAYPCWLELPALSNAHNCQCVTHFAQMQGRMQRNYTILYDPAMFASYWVAYPLCAAHMTTGREETWGYDPKIRSGLQTSVMKGYGASQPTPNYPKNFFARGHQLPNADRNAVPQMQAQTYYSTNITPQLQNGFNGGIWAKLEQAVRGSLAQCDTIYVVTGASFSKVGEKPMISQIRNKNDNKILPVPNYYWKALLKVRRSQGRIVGASAIGFWLPHKDLKGHSYEEFVVSVDQIEAWTGYDLFPNLFDQLEVEVEKSCNWHGFRIY